MSTKISDPFETIESARDFVRLLSEAAAEAKSEIANDVERESDSETRHLDALRIALYSLEKLEFHINRSSRILNDLRTLRRLLFEERAGALDAKSRPDRAKPLPPAISEPTTTPHRSNPAVDSFRVSRAYPA